MKNDEYIKHLNHLYEAGYRSVDGNNPLRADELEYLTGLTIKHLPPFLLPKTKELNLGIEFIDLVGAYLRDPSQYLANGLVNYIIEKVVEYFKTHIQQALDETHERSLPIGMAKIK